MKKSLPVFKKLFNIFGSICFGLLILIIVMRIMYWPGQNILYILICSVLSLLLPIIIILHGIAQKKLLESILLGVSLLVLITGVLYVFMDWPGGFYMLVFGTILGVVSIALTLSRLKQSTVNFGSNGVLIVACFSLILLLGFRVRDDLSPQFKAIAYFESELSSPNEDFEVLDEAKLTIFKHSGAFSIDDLLEYELNDVLLRKDILKLVFADNPKYREELQSKLNKYGEREYEALYKVAQGEEGVRFGDYLIEYYILKSRATKNPETQLSPGLLK